LVAATLPVWACVGSLLPAAWLSALATLEAKWETITPEALSLVSVLRVCGAASLVVGHTLSCRRKPKLSKADVLYLTGATLLVLFFGGGLLAAVTGFKRMAPPPLTVSAAGCCLLTCFLDLGRVAIQPKVATVTRAAVAGALLGSSSLVVAGASATSRLPAATLASCCFLFANSVLLYLLARAKTPAPTAVAQASKVLGSALLLSANAIAFQWTNGDALPAVSGVLPHDLTQALFLAPSFSISFLLVLLPSLYYAAYSL